VLAILISAVTAYLYYARAQISLADRRLLSSGDKYDATVVEIEGQSRPGAKVPRSASPRVRLRFTPPDGDTRTVEGSLAPSLTGTVEVGGTVPIRVNPTDPAIWTDRTEPRSLAAELSMALIFTPIALATIAVVLLRRRGVLNIWRHGNPAVAHVVGMQHSPLAPKSRQLRYALNEGSDRRVCAMLYPVSAGLPAVNDEMLLIIARDNPAKAVVAKLYAE